MVQYTLESWSEKMATLRQIEYIGLLSSYPDTKDKDVDDVRYYLLRHNKGRIEELSKQEASGLIETLFERPVKYVFLCGKEEFISKKDYNRYDMLGELDDGIEM